jgi:hypothetical protein
VRDALLTALEGSGVAVMLRRSLWLYPMVSAAHILGISLLVGAIVALDARILGFARSVPLAAAARVLLPFAVGGFSLAALAGFSLFIVQPYEYAANPAFPVKMGLLVLALANVGAQHLRPAWRTALADGGAISGGVKLAAALSVLLWLAVLVAGRLLGFLG